MKKRDSNGVPTIKVLRGARKLVANEKTWTSNRIARDKDDLGCEASDPAAKKFCALGAVFRVGARLGLGFGEILPLADVLDRIGRRPLVKINDFSGRLAALSVIDAAIRELGYTP